MIIHLFPSEKFTKSYINTINEQFDVTFNYFFVYNYDEMIEKKYNFNSIRSKNITLIDKLSELYKVPQYAYIMDTSEKIIVHSLFYWKDITKFPKGWKNKMCIIFWGGDLQQITVDPKLSLLKMVRYYFQKKEMIKLINYSYAVGTLLDGDCDLLSKSVNLNGKKCYSAMYLNSEYTPETICEKFLCKKVERPWYILVGNNASETNHHIEAFQSIENLNQEDIRVIVPLSYPKSKDTTYLDNVIRIGNEKFGKSFYPLTEFMKFEDYIHLLSKCSVAIFNNSRQQALGNIELMTLLGGKVFINDDNVMWREFVLKEGITLFSFDSILSNNVAELVEYDSNIKLENINRMRAYISKERFLTIWNTIFIDDM